MVYQTSLYKGTGKNKDATIRRISKLEARGLLASEKHLTDEGPQLRRLFLTADGWRYVFTDPALSGEPWAVELRRFLEVRATARELGVLACYLQSDESQAAAKLAMFRGDVVRNKTYFEIRLLETNADKKI